MLASEYSPFDELSAEFIRTFRHTFFFGNLYLQRYDQVHAKVDVSIDKCIPKGHAKMVNADCVSLYGLRGKDERLYHMSPWTFVQWWAPVRTKAPSIYYRYTAWLADCDKDRAEAGIDYVIRPQKFQHKDIYVYPMRANAGEAYERFRNTWFLRRRLKPYVPCPEMTPMPSSKMTSEQRSKKISVYLRAWTLVEAEATVEVPFITDLTLTASEWHNTARGNVLQSSEGEVRSFRSAWQDYLQRVPPAAFRQTRNFMMAVIAEGRNFDRDDTLHDAKSRGTPIVYPVKVEDICNFDRKHRAAKSSQDMGGDDNDSSNAATKLMMSMEAAMAAARRVVESQHNSTSEVLQEIASKRYLRMMDFKVDHSAQPSVERRSRTETYRSDYLKAYADWKIEMTTAEKLPNLQQWQVLDLIHDRCKYELMEERNHCINATSNPLHKEPLFRLVHGLPGSGKSQLLKWIGNYFESVWEWKNGVHFIFLAPLNSMATGISGQTLHSWGGIAFKKNLA